LRIEPQIGPQTQFLKSEADIAILGGAAGGGKTFGLLLDPMRHYYNSEFGGVIFRKTSVQVRTQGGLWDESNKIYPAIEGVPREFKLEWSFPTGMSMSFGHLEYDKDVFNYQGSQIPWMGYDELTHFSEKQFFYMLSRNRSVSGVKPRIRATCNPDPDSWVKKFILWWLDENGEYAVPEKSGILRWFIRRNDELVWTNTKEELHHQFGSGEEIQPKSVTFIPSKLQDNKILMQSDPGYLGNLLALSRVDRLRLLDGNWKVKESAGMLFRREWFPLLDAIPAGFIQSIRFWDRAATKPSETNKDPDWTRGLKLLKYPNNTFLVSDLKSARETPGQIEHLVKAVASHDSTSVQIMSQQDPGSAGVSEAEHFIRMLSGFNVHVETMSKDKVTRAKPVSAQCEVGNIYVLRAPWNDEFFNELENFPEGNHDDIIDCLSGAFNALSHGLSTADALWSNRT
jgi:predicted phage terminase large subunit-like protein